MKILQDVIKFRKKDASFKQSDFKSEVNDKENAVTRTLTIFIKKAHSEL